MMRLKLTAAALAAGLLLSVYPAAGVVTETQYDPVREDSLVTVETATGIRYQFYGADDLVTGDLMVMIMWNAGTPGTILDDAVLDARYSGWWIE